MSKPIFTYSEIDGGYTIYYEDKEIDGWCVARLLNDYFEAKNKMVQAIYDMNDSEEVNIHKFNPTNTEANIES